LKLYLRHAHPKFFRVQSQSKPTLCAGLSDLRLLRQNFRGSNIFRFNFNQRRPRHCRKITGKQRCRLFISEYIFEYSSVMPRNQDKYSPFTTLKKQQIDVHGEFVEFRRFRRVSAAVEILGFSVKKSKVSYSVLLSISILRHGRFIYRSAINHFQSFWRRIKSDDFQIFQSIFRFVHPFQIDQRHRRRAYAAQRDRFIYGIATFQAGKKLKFRARRR